MNKINKYKKDTLYRLWAECDDKDKSTEYMIQYMQDVTRLTHDQVIDFIRDSTDKERQEWYLKERRDLATKKVSKYKLDNNLTDNELCDKLGISRATLYKRLKNKDWKLSELSLIEQLKIRKR